jgi:hypothetical protein
MTTSPSWRAKEVALSRIDMVARVDEGQPHEVMIAELCIKFNDALIKLMEVNNECIELRRELNELKLKVPRHGPI